MAPLLLLLLLLLPLVTGASSEDAGPQGPGSTAIYYTEPPGSNSLEEPGLGGPGGFRGPTELRGGRLTGGSRTLERAKSPYVLREELLVERAAELLVEPGVELRLGPTAGITVRGTILAVGSENRPIVLTSAESIPEPGSHERTARLVDGPSPLEGRLQILHGDEWRSVCTNSRNWSQADLETTCRQLGYQGGHWAGWLDRQWPARPRLLYEQPGCRGPEARLEDCANWASRMLGAGVCEYHPDLGIGCSSRHAPGSGSVRHWRGLRFEHAAHARPLTQHNTLYIHRSKSLLKFVEIRYAGNGEDFNTTAALHIEGVPPQMESISIINSAYTGINITEPDAPILITNCTIQNNQGYGIYVNSSSGQASIRNCFIVNNRDDGIKYVHHDERPDDQLNRAEVYDLCTYPTTSQTFPITISIAQSRNPLKKTCTKHIFTRPGHRLTLSFLQMKTDRNDSASLQVYDGMNYNGKLLARVNVRNGTLPQSVTSARHDLFIVFEAEPRTHMIAFLRLTSGLDRVYDLNVTSSTIADNGGRGIAAEGLRSGLRVDDTSISNSQHVAGIHVLRGVPQVNISSSRLAFNRGDAVNITVTGGTRNISRCSISSNRGYGLAVWLNDSLATNYLPFNQTTVLEYSQIFRNYDVGFLHGNSSGLAYVNVTGNAFNSSSTVAVQIESGWRSNGGLLHLQLGHNVFVGNSRVGLQLSPALNLQGTIEYNHFRDHESGCVLVKNPILEELNNLPTSLLVQHNEFYENRGHYILSLGLSPYSNLQSLLFTRNIIKGNRARGALDADDTPGSRRLVPRSRVSAVLVVSSSNVRVYRNILHNPESPYEIGSHLEDQSQIINCTYNWLGSDEQSEIFARLFHRKDRYNLAKLDYIPYILDGKNPASTIINPNPTYVPRFLEPDTKNVGGEIEGREVLRSGEYIVKRDINIRPGGELILQPGVTLRFPPAVGMMVAGRLDARGTGPNNILMTLKEEIAYSTDNDTIHLSEMHDTLIVPVIEEDANMPVRLLGGKTSREGRLQVRIGDKWGTVCNYGWTMLDAALICQQLGLALDPDNWNLERSHIPMAGVNEDIILSNVQCTEQDFDVTHCKAELAGEFVNSCTHENDVGVRCSEAGWAGVRLGPLALRSDLQFITIERAGLLDYATSSFKPALQLDFARHSLEAVKVVNNLQDGLGIVYADIYSPDAVNMVRNSDFTNNRGNGLSFKQLGLKIVNSRLENNGGAGIRHNPVLSAFEQREFAGWFVRSADMSLDSMYEPLIVPDAAGGADLRLASGEKKYLLTARVASDRPIDRQYLTIACEPGFVIGIQLLNAINNASTERIIIHDSAVISHKGTVWDLTRDQTTFPTVSSSYKIVFEYHSGPNALGGAVLMLTAIPVPMQNTKSRNAYGLIPMLMISNTKIRSNLRGIHASYYNRYLDEIGNRFLRKANESIRISNCEISHNAREAIYFDGPNWNVHSSNLSEVSIQLLNSLVTDNGRGILQYSKDMRQSNNLFHWELNDSTIERNLGGGFELALPYVWQYNENFTHSVALDNNTFQSNENFAFIIDGHFASFNMSYNRFVGNTCKRGLISIRGMEKRMKIVHNRIEKNTGDFMVEFRADSQSEIMGEIYAKFLYNEIKRNARGRLSARGLIDRLYEAPSYVVGFHGIQKVQVSRNLFGENMLDYELLAGVKTAKINNEIDVAENWWGTTDDLKIKKIIFDFDDWNDHAVANFRPYLISDAFDSSISASFERKTEINTGNLGGRIVGNVILSNTDRPYIIKSDITVMPKSVLSISPGVIMEFAPNVGILVLGILKAIGTNSKRIEMRPLNLHSVETRPNRDVRINTRENKVKNLQLCKNAECRNDVNEGFLEYFNETTLQWIPICDTRFTERNAQVVCRQLGYDPLNVYISIGRRYELHPGSLTRIWSWPEPLQCSGKEEGLEDCQVRLNGQLYGDRHECHWDGNFVFIRCDKRNVDGDSNYWGGIRFANGAFEHYSHDRTIHDDNTHENIRIDESILKFVNITGAGILHNEKSAAVQAVIKSPQINYVNIQNSAYHAINLISPTRKVELLVNEIHNALGNGINILSLTGEGRDADESSFTPLRDLNVPYHIFGLLDICDTTKEITIEERVLLYYKYDNNPVNCVKIFRSRYQGKSFGLRLLQFNLYNPQGKFSGRPDSLKLYDGDIYNVTAPVIEELTAGSPLEKKLFQSTGTSLSIKLFATGASGVYGFIAEVVTLPISSIGFNRDVKHNVSTSVISMCQEGALKYSSAGEVNAVITLERNQFINNCNKLFGNFSTCKSSISLDVQNTQALYFRNNLVMSNIGGLSVRADSRGTATSLKGWIHNNLFASNYHKPTLYIEGRQSSPYQEVTIYRNYFMKNNATYENNIVLKQVVSNMSYNYLHANTGKHLLEVSGFERVRLPIYQSTSHNGFYKNFATDREGRSTVVAGTPGQRYVHNIFFNPDNDYELLTINRSLRVWTSSIDARFNYWGYNETLAVAGRIRDFTDSPELLEVDFKPFHKNNESVLGGKCPPGWDLVGDTCYIYIGAPMSFFDARDFCSSANASMPLIIGDYKHLWMFLRKQQEGFYFSDRVWIQKLEKIDQCTMFTLGTIGIDDCRELNPFICEIDPRIHIDPLLSWKKDYVAVAVLSAISIAAALLIATIVLWITKSKKRRIERLERRNSIRQSLHSLRSIGSTNGFSELAYQRRKPMPNKSTDTLNSRTMDYKKMSNNGSIDSMDKSQLNSSLEDNHCYDVYEAHNPSYSPAEASGVSSSVLHQHAGFSGDNPAYDLTFRNEGFRNHSTFTSRNNSAWQSEANSVATPDDLAMAHQTDACSSTLPLDSSLGADSIIELKRELRCPTTPASEPLPEYYSAASTMTRPYYYNHQGTSQHSNGNFQDDRPRSEALLETNFDVEEQPLRSKSEAVLETNFDDNGLPVMLPEDMARLSAGRSHSQPLETAM